MGVTYGLREHHMAIRIVADTFNHRFARIILASRQLNDSLDGLMMMIKNDLLMVQ